MAAPSFGVCMLLLATASAVTIDNTTSWSSPAADRRSASGWVPLTAPCPTCKRSEPSAQPSDQVGAVLTPPLYQQSPTFLSTPIFQQQQQSFLQPQTNAQQFIQQANGQQQFLQHQSANIGPQQFHTQQQIQPQDQNTFLSAQSKAQQLLQQEIQGNPEALRQSKLLQPQRVQANPTTQQQILRLSSNNPNANSQLQVPLHTSSLQAQPIRQQDVSTEDTSNESESQEEEKEEVQLLYVPVETLRQQGRLALQKPKNTQQQQKEIQPQQQQFPQQGFRQSSLLQQPLLQLQDVQQQQHSLQTSQQVQRGQQQLLQQSQHQIQPQQNPVPIQEQTSPQQRHRFQNQRRPQQDQQRQSPQQYEQPQQQKLQYQEQRFQQINRQRTTTTAAPAPHQPPLSVYMGKEGHDVKLVDVINVLKDAKTISVLDEVGPDTPQVFVGPSNLNTPDGYAKFELPYLSALESNRVERKVDKLPFFVAPLSFQPPPGYSKIPFPAPHVGSVVVANGTSDKPSIHEKFNENPITKQTRGRPVNPYSLPAELPPINPELPSLVNSLQDSRQPGNVLLVPARGQTQTVLQQSEVTPQNQFTGQQHPTIHVQQHQTRTPVQQQQPEVQIPIQQYEIPQQANIEVPTQQPIRSTQIPILSTQQPIRSTQSPIRSTPQPIRSQQQTISSQQSESFGQQSRIPVHVTPQIVGDLSGQNNFQTQERFQAHQGFQEHSAGITAQQQATRTLQSEYETQQQGFPTQQGFLTQQQGLLQHEQGLSQQVNQVSHPVQQTQQLHQAGIEEQQQVHQAGIQTLQAGIAIQQTGLVNQLVGNTESPLLSQEPPTLQEPDTTTAAAVETTPSRGRGPYRGRQRVTYSTSTTTSTPRRPYTRGRRPNHTKNRVEDTASSFGNQKQARTRTEAPTTESIPSNQPSQPAAQNPNLPSNVYIVDPNQYQLQNNEKQLASPVGPYVQDNVNTADVSSLIQGGLQQPQGQVLPQNEPALLSEQYNTQQYNYQYSTTTTSIPTITQESPQQSPQQAVSPFQAQRVSSQSGSSRESGSSRNQRFRGRGGNYQAQRQRHSQQVTSTSAPVLQRQPSFNQYSDTENAQTINQGNDFSLVSAQQQQSITDGIILSVTQQPSSISHTYNQHLQTERSDTPYSTTESTAIYQSIDLSDQYQNSQPSINSQAQLSQAIALSTESSPDYQQEQFLQHHQQQQQQQPLILQFQEPSSTYTPTQHYQTTENVPLSILQHSTNEQVSESPFTQIPIELTPSTEDAATTVRHIPKYSNFQRTRGRTHSQKYAQTVEGNDFLQFQQGDVSSPFPLQEGSLSARGQISTSRPSYNFQEVTTEQSHTTETEIPKTVQVRLRGRTRGRQRVHHQQQEANNYPVTETRPIQKQVDHDQQSEVQHQLIRNPHQSRTTKISTQVPNLETFSQTTDNYGFFRQLETSTLQGTNGDYVDQNEKINTGSSPFILNTPQDIPAYIPSESTTVSGQEIEVTSEDVSTTSTSNYKIGGRKHNNFLPRGTPRRPTRPTVATFTTTTPRSTTISNKVYTVRPTRRPQQQEPKITSVRGRIRRPTTSTTTTTTEELQHFPTAQPSWGRQQSLRFTPSAASNEVYDAGLDDSSPTPRTPLQRYNSRGRGSSSFRRGGERTTPNWEQTAFSSNAQVSGINQASDYEIPLLGEETENSSPEWTAQRQQQGFLLNFQQPSSGQSSIDQTPLPSNNNPKLQMDDIEGGAESQWSSKLSYISSHKQRNALPLNYYTSDENKTVIADIIKQDNLSPETENQDFENTNERENTTFSTAKKLSLDQTKKETPLRKSGEELEVVMSVLEDLVKITDEIHENDTIDGTGERNGNVTVVNNYETVSVHENDTQLQMTDTSEMESNEQVTHNKPDQGRRRGGWVRVRSKQRPQDIFETAESQNVATVANNIIPVPATKQIQSSSWKSLTTGQEEHTIKEQLIDFSVVNEDPGTKIKQEQQSGLLETKNNIKSSSDNRNASSNIEIESNKSTNEDEIKHISNLEETYNNNETDYHFHDDLINSSKIPSVELNDGKASELNMDDDDDDDESEIDKPDGSDIKLGELLNEESYLESILATEYNNYNDSNLTSTLIDQTSGNQSVLQETQHERQSNLIDTVENTTKQETLVDNSTSHLTFVESPYEIIIDAENKTYDELSSDHHINDTQFDPINQLNGNLSSWDELTQQYFNMHMNFNPDLTENSDSDLQGFQEHHSSNETLLKTEDGPNEDQSTLSKYEDNIPQNHRLDDTMHAQAFVFNATSIPRTKEYKPHPSRVVGTSTSTEISHETEICYRGRCVKTKTAEVDQIPTD